ncbi:hypothetical protein NDU88_008927 [Pleurodeles waltl]|uniref:Uncharacterized protein n=1 Tax=Pleurodeles waltl TaxID=8319 RepID=A0AAV7QR83_PLEWA|nr:hypothetical protein NDU88_008927 [Pleurodeles waltl]
MRAPGSRCHNLSSWHMCALVSVPDACFTRLLERPPPRALTPPLPCDCRACVRGRRTGEITRAAKGLGPNRLRLWSEEEHPVSARARCGPAVRRSVDRNAAAPNERDACNRKQGGQNSADAGEPSLGGNHIGEEDWTACTDTGLGPHPRGAGAKRI